MVEHFPAICLKNCGNWYSNTWTSIVMENDHMIEDEWMCLSNFRHQNFMKCTCICWFTVQPWHHVCGNYRYNRKPLSSFVSPSKLGIRIFVASVTFFLSKPRSEISIRVWSHTPRFHRYRLFVTKMQFLPYRNTSSWLLTL